MNSHNMSAANSNGASPESAFKHALLAALMSCEISSQHATKIAELHETCDGVNQNISEAERIMDNFNNKEGFKIATNIGCSNVSNIINAIKTAYGNGTLHDVNQQGIYK